MQAIGELLTGFFLPLIVVFLGLYVGAALAFIAPEELKTGKKYFLILQMIFITLIIALILYYRQIPYFVIGGAAVFVLFLLNLVKKDISVIVYALLGILFVSAAYSTPNAFFTAATTMFLYGIPTGTLYASNNKKKTKSLIMQDMLLKYFIFIVVAILVNMLVLTGLSF